MKLFANDFLSYEAAEEYYSLFLFLKKELNEDVLEWEDFNAFYFFSTLIGDNYDYIDKDYLNYIRNSLGKYYLGEINKKAPLDCKMLIDIIYERESLSGKSKEDIENFFLYHLAKALEKDSSSIQERSMKRGLHGILKDLGINKKDKDVEIHEMDLVKIPRKLREMKLEFYNWDNISQKLEFLEESVSDKNCLEVIKNLKKQLKT